MPWWGWVTLGTLLLASELFVVDAAFYLVFVGVSGIVVGMALLFGIPMEPWAQWLVFGLIAIVSMLALRRRIYQLLRGNAVGYDATPRGDTVRLEEDLAPGASSRVQYRGSSWTIVNQSAQLLAAGTSARIEEVDGLTLKVAPDA